MGTDGILIKLVSNIPKLDIEESETVFKIEYKRVRFEKIKYN